MPIAGSTGKGSQLMKAHFDFVKNLITIKKQFSLISRNRFWRSDFITFGFDGKAIDYSNGELAFFAYHLVSKDAGKSELYVMINAGWQPLHFTVAINGPWKQSINTYLGTGDDIRLENLKEITAADYLVGERSVVVLSR